MAKINESVTPFSMEYRMKRTVALVNEILLIRADRYHTTPISAISNPQKSSEFWAIAANSVYDLANYMATKAVMTSASVIHT